ncbi:hypothetical protein ACFQZI_11790 [Mucilaginibacter lutimaris]|uniref:Uncharacterized protein n=1 Tax=Mucilaginibacter lutimaris TaxID=931629 RepID=A0ABW2ZH31_9SPHI
MKIIKLSAISFLALTTIIATSCSKKDSEDLSSTTTISAKIDGKATQFTKNVIAFTGDANGIEFTNVEGKDANGNTLSVTISGALVAGKTYSPATSQSGESPIILYSTVDDVNFSNSYQDKSDVVSITLTAVSGNRIQGTFRGELSSLLNANDPTFKSKSVTEGTFTATLPK